MPEQNDPFKIDRYKETSFVKFQSYSKGYNKTPNLSIIDLSEVIALNFIEHPDEKERSILVIVQFMFKGSTHPFQTAITKKDSLDLIIYFKEIKDINKVRLDEKI